MGGDMPARDVHDASAVRRALRMSDDVVGVIRTHDVDSPKTVIDLVDRVVVHMSGGGHPLEVSWS
jgi:hypothetical protein